MAAAMIDWLYDQVTAPETPRESKLGILYDIGCNLEKGLIKVSPNLRLLPTSH